MSTDDTNTEGKTGDQGRRGMGGRGPRGRHGHGFGPRGAAARSVGRAAEQADLPEASGAADWFAGRLPDDWFVGAPEVVVDRDEIMVIGELAPVDGGEDAAEGRITRWREDTRGERIAIADEAQSRYGRHVTWGARIGRLPPVHPPGRPGHDRLRQRERKVLDTLVDAGVGGRAPRRSPPASRSWASTPTVALRPPRGDGGGRAPAQRRA